MLFVAIDTSSSMVSVALADPPRLLAEVLSAAGTPPGVSLFPMLTVLLEQGRTDLSFVDAIAVACGPGSFTGLRVGMSCAKGLGLGLGKPVTGVPTLEAMAWSRRWSPLPLCPVMDAKRGEIYTALYEAQEGELTQRKKEVVLAPDRFAEFLTEPALVFGDALERYGEELRRLAPEGTFFDQSLSCGYAPAVAGLAAQTLTARGGWTPLEPRYVRPSEAERKCG